MDCDAKPFRSPFFARLAACTGPGLAAGLAVCLAACATAPDGVPGATPRAPVAAQPGPPLWSVSDEDTTIYLFATVDALDPALDWRRENFNRALKAADQIILETDDRIEAQTAAQQALPGFAIYRDGRTLRQVLNDAENQELAATAAALGLPLEALDPLKPWLAAIQLSAVNAVRNNHQDRRSVAAIISQEAAAAGKPVRYRETPLGLLQKIDSLPEATQRAMLIHGAREIRRDPLHHDATARLWAAGDLAALTARIHGGEDGETSAWADETVYEALIVQRNEKWTGAIEALLANETGVILFTAGAGHLTGDDSIIAMLKRRGRAIAQR